MDESVIGRRKLVGAALLIALIAAGGGALLRAASTTAAHGTTTKAEMLTQVGHLWDERDALHDALAGKDAEIATVEAQLASKDAQIAALEQRVCELDPGSCGGGDGGASLAGVVPGTGQVLFADDLAGANLEDNWQISDPWRCSHCSNKGGDPRLDPYIVKRTGDGSPYLPIGDSEPNPVYRRFHAEPGVQSIYDQGGSATRTQLIKAYRYRAGTTTISYVDVRRRAAGFPFDLASGGGNTNFSQLLQLKDWDNTPFPITYLGRDGIKLTFSSQVQQVIPAPEGLWVRIALETRWGSDGYMQLWGDLDQTGSMERVGPRHTVDLPAIDAYFSLGLYHRMEHFTEPIHVDIANPVVTTMAG